ncbi:TraB/GumN family protein [Parapedomonas caeni]
MRPSRLRGLINAVTAGVLACGLLLGGATAARARQDAPAATVATPALWVIHDHDTVIFLFGTSHLLPEGLRWFDGPVKAAFDTADTLVLETVMPDDPAAIAPLIRQLGLNPPDRRLTDQLPPKVLTQLETVAGQVGLPMAALDTMRPWLAGTTIAVTSLTQLGFDPRHGAEEVLKTQARAAGKTIMGLETPGQQFGFFASLPPAEETALLAATLNDFGKLRQESGALIDDWARGDVEKVGERLNESMSTTPLLARVLIDDRNARWAEWIAARLAKPGRLFVAVGAGHLAGGKSVQNLLAAKGLTVARLANPGQ